MPFQPGQSGNPNGRPPLASKARDFRQRCQDFMAKSGWKALEQMADDPKSPHRYRSLELITAYAYGRPTQPVSGDVDPESAPIRVTVVFDHNNADDETGPA